VGGSAATRGTDRALTGELMATLSAVFDLAAAALAVDSAKAAAHYRAVGNANLQVAARLLEHLARSGKIDQPAAAGAGSSGITPSAAVSIPEEAAS
jgi:hypothetical protein